MKAAPTILEEHLERISARVMEDYRDVLRDMIRGRSGVYALYDAEELYYVGLASNMMGRLKNHVRDRHKGLWDRFSVYLTARPEQAHIRELEALLLRIIRPKGNRVGGRLRAAKNLYPALQRAMTDQDAERRAEMLGGRAARVMEKRLEKSEKKKSGSVRSPQFLRAIYKGERYSAMLRKDGQVRYNHALYPSLRAAAKAVAGRPINGRHFWMGKHKGEWVRLRRIGA
jgi:hypothetical protein